MTKFNVGDKVIWNYENEPPEYKPTYDLSQEIGEVFVVVGDKKVFLRYKSGEYQANQENVSLYKEPKQQESKVVEYESKVPEIRESIQFNLAVWNFDATPFRLEAEQYVAKYHNLDVTEEDVKEINRIIAELNKKSKEFDSVRKEVKKEYNRPFDEFQKEIESITSVYQSAVDNLKSKLEVYEQQYIQEKTELVNQLIADAIEEFKLNAKYASQITLLPKYLNKTETKAKIKKDLAARCQTEFSNQENERLAEEARAEKLQRRLDTLKQLNQNYAGRIKGEVLHKDTANMSDEMLFEWFKKLADEYEEANKPKEEPRLSDSYQLPLPKINQVDVVDEVEAPVVVEQSPLGDVPVVAKEKVNPQVKFTYICTISTTATEDTILPWLKKMKEHGIFTFVHKKELQDDK